ncbi:E3 ubiquitin-protein ligase rha2a [Phtheirospermum japonicum]|uniref:E3 ubiquitin-protein ligase rha2a n=1 Tax=Phtheirospermum japonicum TaxID=374723 RepID=A0A830B4N5_9LAMI|nr:E3 ubiquitin-protein ligase rha2a [Phtheirospermum japonicum]
MVVLIAKGVSYLHSSLLAILHHLFEPEDRHNYDSSLYAAVGSGLTSLIVLCDQLSLNRARSYPHRSGSDADCVVCLDRLGEGDHVRRLACSHVFHRGCLDGWLDHLNFSCPLCRAPLVSDERVAQTRRRVTGDLLAWFPDA